MMECNDDAGQRSEKDGIHSGGLNTPQELFHQRRHISPASVFMLSPCEDSIDLLVSINFSVEGGRGGKGAEKHSEHKLAPLERRL